MGEPLSGTSPPNGSPPEVRLDSWKEIAAYLKRDVTTVQRWERREGMPVHRHLHDKRGSVYAVAPELGAWLQSRKQRLAGQEDQKEDEKEPPPELSPEPEGGTGRKATRQARGWLVWAAIALVAVVAAIYLVSRSRGRNTAQPKIGSLAVLPLKNLSG